MFDDAPGGLALQAAARGNEASRTLADPVGRAGYLLSLSGVEAFGETDTALAFDFLERQLDRRERASLAADAHDESALEVLLDEVRKHLPNDELLYAEDEITDKSERFLASEYIREKLFRLIGDELPYAATVEVEKFELDGALRRISAAIVVDRQAHKGIVIGKGGETLKRIATEARQDMERLFDGKVFLEIFVKVKSGWADDERLLKSLGYE